MRRLLPSAALSAATVAALLPLASAGRAEPGQPAGTGVRVNGLKVLSDRTDDVTTVENILKSFCKPGMSDADRAKALWKAAIRYRHQAPPPNEQLAGDWEAHDPVKLFNVYGYCMCCCSSSLMEALNRADGRESRGRILNGHSVPEVFYDGGWHMFDASLITYFPKADGSVASVDEIAGAVADWYAQNPGYQKNPSKLVELMRSDGWTGWKAKGPALLAASPFYNQGWFPARTHGWDATMQEYDRKSEVYEYGYQVGHRALFSLRPGESFLREAGHRGLHVNGNPSWDGLRAKAPKGDLGYVSEYLPGYTGGVVGNGVHRWAPDLASGGFEAGAIETFNVTHSGGQGVRPVAAGRESRAVVEMASPWVYLGGRLKLRAHRGPQDTLRLLLSTNNGRTFTPVWTAPEGSSDTQVDLGDRIARRYSYLLKVEMQSALGGSSSSGAGLDGIIVESDFQHAPRTLPWLGKGANTITVAADGETRQATRTVSCRITADPAFSKNETTATMGVTFDNMDVKGDAAWWKGGTGSMTVPIETPGDLTALRFGAHVRARGDRDVVKLLASFDGGKTWTEAGKITGPTPATTKYFRFTNVPPATRKALLRYQLTGSNTIGIFSFRVDADYVDPLAAPSVAPFEVVHRWKEGGQEKTHRERVTRLPFSYRIDAAGEPEMVSVSYEMPSK